MRRNNEVNAFKLLAVVLDVTLVTMQLAYISLDSKYLSSQEI
jgi:hypothetical protein